MVVRQKSCDPERLRLLAEDRLPADELGRLEDHLQHCAGCREELDSLSGGESWRQAVRQYLGGDPTDHYESGPLADLMDPLGFLAPSDWPDSLGRLGTYEVKGVIGRGGMGVVLKAFDPALSRNVAIKVLSAPLATCGAARRRFLREAKAAAAVVHEHVVSVFSVDERAGLPFLVMEYIAGHSLQDRLDQQGPLALAEILRIGMQTAAGLAAAHAQGLVHRDVKPANILLENGIERVKLTDFGLARAAADASMTQSGLIAGTPHYMAPEQTRGESTDHRADLFSLGSTLYATCAGYPPFRAESPLAVLRRVSDDTPTPLRRINPEVPEWLEAIVEKLHSKDPARRFASASEVADLLGRCLAHVQAPLAVDLPSGLVLSARRTRSRLLWAAASLLGLATVVGGAVVLRPGRPPRIPATSPHAEDVPNVARTLSPSLDDPDEIDQAARDAWTRSGSIEADLHRRADEGGFDSVVDIARRLADRARVLEQEIGSGRDPAPTAPMVYPFLNPNDRR